jgi:Ca2+-binding EF-hand superfamily protein
MISKLKLLVASAALVIGGLSVTAFAKGGMAPRKAAMLAKFDANNDGQLDDAEKANAISARKAMREKKRAAMLAKFDSNKDGSLDQAEKTAMRDQRIEQRFAKLDANKDGAISLEEMKAGKAMHKGHKKHRKGF